MAFTLPILPYSYDSLEPFYDAQTVEIHHAKHHNAYTVNFNKAIESAGITEKSVEEILSNLESIPEDKRKAVINHGGGYWNHTFFWDSMTAKKGGSPVGKIADEITHKFSSFDAFKEAFAAKAAGHFGSGWAWLVINKKGDLEITDTHDQICPLSLGHKPLLTVDVWEHAYYLKYKNLRTDWISAWWSLVNWEKVNERFIN